MLSWQIYMCMLLLNQLNFIMKLKLALQGLECRCNILAGKCSRSLKHIIPAEVNHLSSLGSLLVTSTDIGLTQKDDFSH